MLYFTTTFSIQQERRSKEKDDKGGHVKITELKQLAQLVASDDLIHSEQHINSTVLERISQRGRNDRLDDLQLV